LDKLDAQEMQSIARDVGASSYDLRALAGKWPDSADLLSRRMTALNLSPSEVAQSMPLVSRDMSRACSLCGEKRECERDLDRGVLSPGWLRYCPNAQTLTALLKQRNASHAASDDRPCNHE
jgi:hypothetical protein